MPAPPTQLILITGLPGSGKTTFARALAQAMEVPHLNTDGLRREMNLRGQYDEAIKQQVYQELLLRTTQHLQDGQSVVVDATFYTPTTRAPFLQLAAEQGVNIRWIELQADEDVIRNRVSYQRPDSEADFNVYLKIKEKYTAPAAPHLQLRSDQLSLAEMVRQARHYLTSPLTVPQHDPTRDHSTAA